MELRDTVDQAPGDIAAAETMDPLRTNDAGEVVPPITETTVTPPPPMPATEPTGAAEDSSGIMTIDNGSNSDSISMTHLINSFPRSIRWRIQLGLLVLSETESADNAVNALTVEDIYKSNSELIEKQQQRFSRLMKRYVEEEEKEQKNTNNQTSQEGGSGDGASGSPADDLDPLTAMVREQEAQETRREQLYMKYKKERARRRRGLSADSDRKFDEDGEDDSGYVDRASISIIEKDLKRLPHPTEKAHEQESRIAILKELLYIYSQEHPTMGYRQGMHEIASYILLVFELEEKATDDEDAHNEQFAPFVACAYHVLESILALLQTAYDACGEGALELMSRTILGKIYQNDQMLYQHLTASQNIPPPPIYCTRWVRLLFSREVAGYENVMEMWDGLLGHNAELMSALEIASATRILLMRDALLHPQTNSLEILVNTPAISDVPLFLVVFEKMMNQKEGEPAIEIPKFAIELPTPPVAVSAVGVGAGNPEDGDLSASHDGAPPTPSPKPLQSPRKSGSFSLKAMRETLGQDLKSIKKKVIATTTEWKQQVSQREQGSKSGEVVPAEHIGAIQALRDSLGGRSRSEDFASNSNQHSRPPSTSSPLHMPSPFEVHEMMRRQRTHGERLQQHVWTLQQFLMSIEQVPHQSQTDPLSVNLHAATIANNNSNTNMPGGRVPGDIWESLADIDRIQRDLQGMPPR